MISNDISKLSQILKKLAEQATNSHSFSITKRIEVFTLAYASYSTGSYLFGTKVTSDGASNVRGLNPNGVIP